MPQEIHLSEPREKIIHEISAYAGRQLIVRSRDPFLAQIDRVEFSDNTILISGTLLAVLADVPILAPDILDRMMNKRFEFSANWDIVAAGHGSFYASQVSWGLFYDQRLNREVSRLHTVLGKTRAFPSRVSSIIEAWQRGHRSQILALSS
jgi:hypothetical protein